MNGSKKNFFINLLIAGVVILSFLYVCMNYLVRDIEASSAKIVESKKEIYVLSSKNGQLSSLEKKYDDVQTKMNKAFETIVDKGDSVDFIKWSEDTAQKNKVKMNMQLSGSSKDSKKESSTFISGTNFTFTVGGRFDDLMRFLFSMENSKYDVDISNIKINTGDFDEYNKNMIILSFDLKLYQKNSQK